MAAGSTESFYVPIEISKILKKRHYNPDYEGRDIPVMSDGTVFTPFIVKFKDLVDEVFPMVSWQDAFRFLRERYGIYAYIKRDTYWQKWRFVFERDSPRGEHISAVYDTIDEARVALFKRIDEEEIPRIFEDPNYYKYSFTVSAEEKEEAKKWRDDIEESRKRRREETKKEMERPLM